MVQCYIVSILTVLANGNQSVAILNTPELLQVTVGFLSRKIVIFVSAALEKVLTLQETIHPDGEGRSALT